MQNKQKTILICGLGMSGKSLIEFYKNSNTKIYAYDNVAPKDQSGFLFTKSLNKFSIKNIDEIFLSPGFDKDIYKSFFEKVKRANIQISTELEIASSKTNKKELIAITGTNGKTTTTSLVWHILCSANKKVYAVGNIGRPLLDSVISKEKGYKVCECSSFQLDLCKNFSPKIAAILNIGQDHLDRHKTIENYINAKLKITTNQTKNDFLVLNFDDKLTSALCNNTKASCYYFSTQSIVKGVFVSDNNICFWNGKISKNIKTLFSANKIKLLGKKNLENVLAGVLICKLLKIKDKFIEEGVKTFLPLKNRLELVATSRQGVQFVNDSKATNISSTISAISSFDKNIVLLLGGRGKGQNFEELANNITNNVKKIICYGEDGKNIFSAFAGKKFASKASLVDSFYNAFELACKVSKQNDIVLLSPACASFDEFSSYEERGDVFRRLASEQIKI